MPIQGEVRRGWYIELGLVDSQPLHLTETIVALKTKVTSTPNTKRCESDINALLALYSITQFAAPTPSSLKYKLIGYAFSQPLTTQISRQYLEPISP